MGWQALSLLCELTYRCNLQCPYCYNPLALSEYRDELSTLPFAAQIKTLTRSAPLPVAVIAVVDARLPDARAKVLQSALIKMNSTNAEMLASLRLKGFVLPQLPGDAGKP